MSRLRFPVAKFVSGNRLLCFVVGVVVFTTCAAIGWAASAGGFRAARISPTSEYAEYPVVGVDASGDQTVAWTDYRSDPPEYSVVTTTRRAGSSAWSSPLQVSDVNDDQSQPTLAIGPSGAGVIAWTETVRQGRKLITALEAATRASAATAWRPPVRIVAPGALVSGYTVGIDGHGTAVVVWDQGEATNPAIQWADGNTASGLWTDARQVVAPGQGGLEPQLAVSSRGNAIVAWARQVGRTNHRNSQPLLRFNEMVSYRSADGAWRAPARIGQQAYVPPNPGGNAWGPTTPSVVLDSRGAAAVTWESSLGGGLLEVAHRSASSGRWGSPVGLTKDTLGMLIGMDAQGRITVAWDDRQGRILTTESSNGTHWSPFTTLPGAAPQGSWLSVGPDGHAVMTWSGPDDQVLISERRGPHDGWTRPVPIGRGYFPQAGLDSANNATVVWPRLSPDNRFGSVIYAASYPAR